MDTSSRANEREKNDERLLDDESATSTPNFFAAARILGMAFSPNGDCGALASALRTWAASWTGKCRNDRGTVFPDESFEPPGSMYAKSESGRSLMLADVISARSLMGLLLDLPACSSLAWV